MANICCDTVIFYPEDVTDTSALHKFSNDLRTCYSDQTPISDGWLGLLFEYLPISMDCLYLRGNIINMELQDGHIRLDLDTAWHPLFGAYQALSEYYSLSFVFQSEETGSNIFINTDTNGHYLTTRYRILLYLENDATGTLYEKLFREETDTDFYFSSEKEILDWLSGYGIWAENLEELKQKLDDDFIQMNKYELTCEYGETK